MAPASTTALAWSVVPDTMLVRHQAASKTTAPAPPRRWMKTGTSPAEMHSSMGGPPERERSFRSRVTVESAAAASPQHPPRTYSCTIEASLGTSAAAEQALATASAAAAAGSVGSSAAASAG